MQDDLSICQSQKGLVKTGLFLFAKLDMYEVKCLTDTTFLMVMSHCIGQFSVTIICSVSNL